MCYRSSRGVRKPWSSRERERESTLVERKAPQVSTVLGGLRALQEKTGEIDEAVTDPDTGLAAIHDCASAAATNAAELAGAVTSIQEILTGTPSQEEEEPDLGLTGKINDMATQLEIIDQNIGRAPEGGAGTQPLVDGIYGYVVNVAERLTTLEENVGHPAATTPKPVPITGIYEQLTDLRTLVVKMRAIEQTNNILTSVPLLAGYAGLICAMHEHIMFTQLAANGPTMPTGTWEHAINGPSNNDDCRTVIVIDTSTPTTRNGAIYALDRAEQTRITIIDGNATTPTCKPTDLETDIQLMRSEHHTNQIHEFMLIRCADFLLSGTKPTLTSLIGYAYDTIKKPYDLYVSFPHNAICGAIQPSLISEGRITHIRYLATQ